METSESDPKNPSTSSTHFQSISNPQIWRKLCRSGLTSYRLRQYGEAQYGTWRFGAFKNGPDVLYIYFLTYDHLLRRIFFYMGLRAWLLSGFENRASRVTRHRVTPLRFNFLFLGVLLEHLTPHFNTTHPHILNQKTQTH